MTLIVDGTKLLNAIELSLLTNNAGGPAQTFTSADGNTTVSFSVTASGAYYTYVATIDTLPGKHTIGLEILGANPPIVLSEAQQSYTLLPGTNSPATLTLLGVLATSYVECASGPVDATNCQSSFTPGSAPGTGSYQLTAVGADFDGFPIVNQSVPFDNGPFTVVESDTLGILTLTNAGPFSTPGNQLLGNSGGYYVSGTAPYGQSFNASCNKTGTATVALTTTQVGPNVPLAGETYTYFDPSNNFPTSGNYPNAGTLATGSKTPGNPVYHNGNNPNPVTNLASISCDANLSLTVN
jgi:hypothetical protein